jgi:hypothetical protein
LFDLIVCFFLTEYGANFQKNQLTSIYLVIDKDNAAVERRKGTWAVSEMLCTVVAASMIYWIRFLKFAVVGMVGIVDGEGAVCLGLYIFCCVPPTGTVLRGF